MRIIIILTSYQCKTKYWRYRAILKVAMPLPSGVQLQTNKRQCFDYTARHNYTKEDAVEHRKPGNCIITPITGCKYKSMFFWDWVTRFILDKGLLNGLILGLTLWFSFWCSDTVGNRKSIWGIRLIKTLKVLFWNVQNDPNSPENWRLKCRKSKYVHSLSLVLILIFNFTYTALITHFTTSKHWHHVMITKLTWTNWYLWSRCSPSWQSRHVSFTQLSQYSISGSLGCVGHINERCFEADVAADKLPEAAAAEAFGDILSIGTTLCSLVTLTRRCACAHGSHSHSLQSVQKWLAATFSSHPVQLRAIVPSTSLSPARVFEVSATNMLSIMFESMLTWRHTQHVTCPSANKHITHLY